MWLMFPGLSTYMIKRAPDIHSRWDGQNTDPDELSVRENYLAIEWTKLRAEKLGKFYDSAPVEMQCTSGAGTPLPGKWTGMSQPVIREILPPPARPVCKPEQPQEGQVPDLEPSRPDSDLDQEGEQFRERFWTEDRRKRVELRKRSEIRKKWIGRQFEVKKRSESFTSEPVKYQNPKVTHNFFFSTTSQMADLLMPLTY